MSEDTYQIRLGQRLRAIRAQQDLTLQDVEDRSEGRWKAVVVGSYERGDRAISISKLAELGRFYGVPLADLLPQPGNGSAPESSAERGRRLVLDLTRLEGEVVEDPQLSGVHRFVQRIQVRRGDYNGRVLTLREGDLSALAVVFDTDTDALIETLDARELIRAT